MLCFALTNICVDESTDIITIGAICKIEMFCHWCKIPNGDNSIHLNPYRICEKRSK